MKYKRNKLYKYTILILTLTLICSCSVTRYNHYGPIKSNSPDTRNKIYLLQYELAALSDEIDFTEARQLAETSITYSHFLANEYKLVRPPYLHNILVRIGIKNRGLCYHWTEDLIKRLASLELKSFTLHKGVAHKGSELREHNTVVVTAKGQEFSKGIVLDPWRDSGDLYWARVNSDRYPWVER